MFHREIQCIEKRVLWASEMRFELVSENGDHGSRPRRVAKDGGTWHGSRVATQVPSFNAPQSSGGGAIHRT